MGKAKIHTGMAQKAYEMSVALVLKHVETFWLKNTEMESMQMLLK